MKKESWAWEKQSDFDDDFLCLFNDLTKFHSDSVRETLHQQLKLTQHTSNVEKASIQINLQSVDWSNNDCIFIKKYKGEILTDVELNELQNMNSCLYGDKQLKLCTSVKVGKELYINGSVLCSKHSIVSVPPLFQHSGVEMMVNLYILIVISHPTQVKMSIFLSTKS